MISYSDSLDHAGDHVKLFISTSFKIEYGRNEHPFSTAFSIRECDLDLCKQIVTENL